MKFSSRVLAGCFAVAFLLASATEAGAFSLLGPVQPWMQSTNGVIIPGDIGGPMPIGSGYRWNVAELTYGFDQSFLDFFGSNGVAAVEGAFQILNELPPASQLVLTNFPLGSELINFRAQSQSLCDLKSATLSLLAEHLGLASPKRYIYVIRQWNSGLTGDSDLLEDTFGGSPATNYIVARNYDPQSLAPTPYLNNNLYTGQVLNFGNENEISVLSVSPLGDEETVADFLQDVSLGVFYNGLTRDDVGGLKYLLSKNTVHYETLLPDVVGTGGNSDSHVNGAWRPGVDKITFVRQPMDPKSGAFLPVATTFVDRYGYATNRTTKSQKLKRMISQPDFLFSVADVTLGSKVLLFTRTSTTNWLNEAAANGTSDGSGPGIIQPQVQIVFNKLGRQVSTSAEYTGDQVFDQSIYWGSFNESTNAPIVYPITQSRTNQTTLRMWLQLGVNSQRSFVWQPGGLTGAIFAMQTSTNLANWTTLFTITNNGSVNTYYNQDIVGPNCFYRLVPR